MSNNGIEPRPQTRKHQPSESARPPWREANRSRSPVTAHDFAGQSSSQPPPGVSIQALADEAAKRQAFFNQEVMRTVRGSDEFEKARPRLELLEAQYYVADQNQLMAEAIDGRATDASGNRVGNGNGEIDLHEIQRFIDDRSMRTDGESAEHVSYANDLKIRIEHRQAIDENMRESHASR